MTLELHRFYAIHCIYLIYSYLSVCSLLIPKTLQSIIMAKLPSAKVGCLRGKKQGFFQLSEYLPTTKCYAIANYVVWSSPQVQDLASLEVFFWWVHCYLWLISLRIGPQIHTCPCSAKRPLNFFRNQTLAADNFAMVISMKKPI